MMKIGVLTYHRSLNYGAYLQAFALSHALNSEDGFQVELIDFQMPKEIEHYKTKVNIKTLKHPIRFVHSVVDTKKQRVLFEKDMEKQLLSVDRCVSDSIDDFVRFVNNKYDAIITGSDEIWKTNGLRGFPTPYWLLGDLGCQKYAYAASGRNSYSHLSNDKIGILRAGLDEYEYIGVRDSITKKEIEKYIPSNKRVQLCCDPTFLFDFQASKENGFRLLKERFGVERGKRIVALMTEDEKISKHIRKKLAKKDFQLISLYQWQPGCINCSQLSPFEWLDVLSCVDIVMTSFFHAVCFAAKLGKPMIAFGTRGKGSKVEEVISQVGRMSDYYANLYDIMDRLSDEVACRLAYEPECYHATSGALEGYSLLVEKLFMQSKEDGVAYES